MPDQIPDESLKLKDVELALRRPGKAGRGLRGWDAADELLLERALENLEQAPGQRLLVIDDQFGALALALGRFAPVILADSATLSAALDLNGTPETPFARPSSWLEAPAAEFDLVVMRIPRQADYLAWILRWVNQVLGPKGLVIAGGMIKHLPDRSAQVFADLVNTRTVCPARKKARVVISQPGQQTLEDWDGRWQGYELPGTSLRADALPAVFSRRKLDIGTRELLPFVRRAAAGLKPGSRVLDLACGNGVLGLTALAGQEHLHVTFSDVSSQAILSARYNVERAFPGSASVFVHCDGTPAGHSEFDLILLNPPFHEGGVVGDHIALALFEQAARALARSGRLLMVGNRHLGYHRTLKSSFGHIKQLASTPKFVVFEARHQVAARP